MQYRRLAVFLLCGMLAMAGCGKGLEPGKDVGTTNVTATITGPASLKASLLSKAAIPSQVASVVLEAKKPDCSGTAAYTTKMDTAGQTSVAFNFTLTAGSTACFTAGAYSGAGGAGTLLYQGSTSGINLVAGESVNVEVSLSEVGAAKPTVTTDAATSIGATATTLNATTNPNGFETTAYFEWGIDTTYGNITPIQSIGSGTANVAISQALTGLTAGTTYHYRAVANNSGNTVYGNDQSLTTINTTESGVTVTFPSTSAPTATTNAATSVTGTGATLNATVNPQGSATTAYFEWGTITSYGNTTAWQEIGNGTTDVAVSAVLTGLTTGTTYHYRIVAYNAHGLTTGVDGTVTASDSPMTLATGLNIPCGIAVDSNGVYWTENAATGGSVKKISINGGTAITLASGLNAASGGQGCLVVGVRVDSGSVYWGEVSTVYNGNDAAVKKVPISGGTVTTLASGLNQLAGIAVDSANVYFAGQGLSEVSKVSKSGGTVTTLGNMWNYPIGVAVDSTSVYGAVNNNWWAGNGSVQKISINGGNATTLASGLNAPLSIAVDTTSVYWTDSHVYNGGNAQQSDGTGAVKKVSVNGGTVTTLATGLNRPNSIVVDSASGYVYWAETGTYTGDTLNNGTGTVKKVPIGGGTVTTLASGLNYPYGIVVDSTSVYWSEIGTSTNGVYNTGSGTLKKMLK